MNQYHKLYTPEDSAIVFIDQQPQMTFRMASADRATMINNVTLLARVAKEFNVPAALTAIEALLEWQRDWARREHYDALMGILKQQGGAYGVGVEYAYTMVHHAPQSAKKPQVVTKKSAGDGHGRGVTPVAAPARR